MYFATYEKGGKTHSGKFDSYQIDALILDEEMGFICSLFYDKIQ